jgi:hypothetical protein
VGVERAGTDLYPLWWEWRGPSLGAGTDLYPLWWEWRGPSLRAGGTPGYKGEEKQPPVQDAHEPHVVHQDREAVHLACTPEMDLGLQRFC